MIGDTNKDFILRIPLKRIMVRRGVRRGNRVHMFKKSMVLHSRINDVFPFFSDADNLERITPPELCFHIVTPPPIAMGKGTIIDYKLRLLGVPFTWRAQICRWEPPFQFTDEQIQGPYRLWIHHHRFFDLGEATRVTDEVLYALPWWPLGEAAFPLVQYLLLRIFRFREWAINTIFHEDRVFQKSA